MILPEHIKIGFEVYSVAVGSGIEGEGECHPEKGSILVKSGMSDRRYASTIIHEVLHACWDQAELPEGDADLAGLKEEDVIARLSNILTAALLDSPQLRQMLERVAGTANGTCWTSVEPPPESRPFSAAAVENAMHHGFKEVSRRVAEDKILWQSPWMTYRRIGEPRTKTEVPVSDVELPENPLTPPADNEPRSVYLCVACGEDTPCGCPDCLHPSKA